jgi:ATP-dependent exoDNAse (exonuclease V) beta subunit
LRAAGIAFAAVEIDALGERQSVRDLASLTHALIQPADRLAAHAVLRAPWCGLALADLLAVSPLLDRGLPGLFAHPGAVEGVGDDGAARIARIAAVLAPAFEEHARGSLAERAHGAWVALGGPATLEEPIDLAAAADYFAILREVEHGGDVADWQAFCEELLRRFATSTQDVFAKVKVMTLFKAKGLEFHTVVIPGLAAQPGGNDVELLKWRTRPGDGLLLATVRARGGDKDPIYDYLQRLLTAEADHELGRILYVGATRAKRRLHLVAMAGANADGDSDGNTWKPPQKGSALAKLWEALVPERSALPPYETSPDAPPRTAPALRRLPLSWQAPAPTDAADTRQARRCLAPPPPYAWAQATASKVGTVSHRLLAQAAREGLHAFDDERIATLAPRVSTELLGEGVEASEIARASGDVIAVLRALRDDERARWLFDPAHAEAVSEWALAGVDEGAVVHVALDRSFVAEGVRWIVDFKTGRHEGAGVADFLDREVARYRRQLERYARIVHALDPRPIMLGLYYPLVRDGWREWPWEPPGAQRSLF